MHEKKNLQNTPGKFIFGKITELKFDMMMDFSQPG